MAFVTTNALCVPAMAAPAPRRSLTVTMASAKSPERLGAAAIAGSAYAGGQRRAITLFSTADSASRAVICRSAKADVSTKTGQWEEIEDMSDPYIQDLGKWAVTEHNMNLHTGEAELQFDKVVGSKKQVVEGMNYILYIDTKEPSGSYVAEMFVSLPPEKRQLKSFKNLYHQ